MSQASSSKESDRPLVSVVVLARNSESHIREALLSLVRQTYSNLDILIVDGGSTDGTLDIVRSIGDHRIRIVTQPGRGLADARNLGVRDSLAEYVAYLDSDDVALPQRIERQLSFLLSHPDYIVVGSWLRLVDGEGRVLATRRYPVEDEQIRRAIASYNPLPNPGVMFRKTPLVNAGLYTERLPEDYDLWFRLLNAGKLHNLPEVFTEYRVHLQGSKVQTPKYQLKWSLELRYRYWRMGTISMSPGALWNNFVQILLLLLPSPMLVFFFKRSVRRGWI